ncbi:MAG: PEGA domain protein [Candidatus Woesebacteria bacterium GW2011_GWB1_38_8]|uniref:PEGA domain protein n=2 Tax=Candidatus Woeseibacteriota TaxID=1752722 RepID=A0A0G0P8B2_9BACT|nr:MAG: PEGA domain protein [Candidatus Woesebacteria bacterium GW2011_GWB1_38_8]
MLVVRKPCHSKMLVVNFDTMKKIKILGLVLGGLILIIGLIFFAIGFLRPKVAGVYIETNPPSTVFIDGFQVGRTPYDETIKPKEVIIKLIPESFQIPLAPYEAKVNLLAGVKTVIKRDFGEAEEDSAGDIISFEKIGRNESGLAVVSVPDSARLIIDGRERAFTPHKTSSILPGTHTLTLSADGYMERIVEVKIHEGYKLTAIVKLAKGPEPTPTPTPNQVEGSEAEGKAEEPKVEIEILSTDTGFLRVRKEPSTLGEEVGRVQPGEKYPLIEIDSKTGWYKIEFQPAQAGEEGKQGWISNQYAKKIGGMITPTPTSKLIPKLTVTPTPLYNIN